MTSALTDVCFWTLIVLRAASLRVGSVSQRSQLLGLAFDCIPGVGEVESEVTAKASSLARRSKPLSSILTSHYTHHAVADLPYYASSLAVNPSFSQLAGAKAVRSKCWGSISFAEMEKLERLFRAQLEMTSKSLWLMSGILAMLKHDGFQPADPTLFNAALASASASCLRRLGPLRPVPPSFALSAGIHCLRILRFLCLRHNAVPLRCLLGQSHSSLTRRS